MTSTHDVYRLTRLVTVGEAMLLLFNEHVGALQPGTLFRTGVGGAELNVALTVACLGAPVDWIGVVGEDAAGDVVLAHLAAGRVGTRYVRRNNRRTGLLIRERRTSMGSRVHYWRHDSAGSTLRPADIPHGLLDRDVVLHLTGITPALGADPAEAAITAFDRGKHARATITFDVNYRSRLWDRSTARKGLLPFAGADVVFATIGEAALLAGFDEPPPTGSTTEVLALAAAVQELGAGSVVIKQGAAGAMLLTADGRTFASSAPLVPVLDTVGAGDAFVGGYISALLDTEPPEACLTRAVRAGSYAVTVPGDSEVLPTLDELDRLDAQELDLR